MEQLKREHPHLFQANAASIFPGLSRRSSEPHGEAGLITVSCRLSTALSSLLAPNWSADTRIEPAIAVAAKCSAHLSQNPEEFSQRRS